jgi:hypothetical protein
MVVEVVRHLMGEHPQYVIGQFHVRRAQERRLLGQMAPAAARLHGAGHACEDRPYAVHRRVECR